MRRILPLVSALSLIVALPLATAPASADDRRIEAEVASTSITLVVPSTFCALDPTNQVDARMLGIIRKAQAGKNYVLSQIANCEQLQAWRTGKRKVLDDLGGVTTPIQYANQTLPYTRAQLVAQLAQIYKQQGGAILRGATNEVNRRIGSAAKNMRINETKFLGILAQDADAVYVGLLQKLQTEFGDSKIQIGVTGVTLVKGKMLSISVYTPAVGENSSSEALATTQDIVRKTIAANGG